MKDQREAPHVDNLKSNKLLGHKMKEQDNSLWDSN